MIYYIPDYINYSLYNIKSDDFNKKYEVITYYNQSIK